MLDEKLKAEIKHDIKDKFSFIEDNSIKDKIKETLENSKGVEKEMILATLGMMPISDILSYDFDVIMDFVKHGVYLWENKGFNYEIPFEIFVGYVLNYRVNNEDIVRHRKFFYEKVKELIVPDSMERTIININYWCGKEVTYKSTDERTANPLTVYNSGYGRCGEESTFTVSVLRSIGIPARQVYAPLWAHCDDNHAWVEAWCDGQWKFLGACEPEEVLNKGWFNRASTRAMMIHSKYLLPIASSDIVGKEGISYVLNQTKRYAKCKKIKIKVFNKENKPVNGAKLRFFVLNYGGYGEIASLYTDIKGEAEFLTGYGSILISAFHGNKYAERLIFTGNHKEIEINIDEKVSLNNWEEVELIVPESNEEIVPKYTKKVDEIEKEKKENCKNQYQKKIDAINKSIIKIDLGNNEVNTFINNILETSSYNYKEILNFIKNTELDLQKKIGMLKHLSVKDYRDIQESILTEELKYSPDYDNKIPYDIYEKYVLNLRVENEFIRNNRKFILEFIEKNNIEKNVKGVIEYVNFKVKSENKYEYGDLVTELKGALKAKAASEKSKKIIIVQILRTIGIASRINKTNGYLEVYTGKDFKAINEANESKVSKVLINTKGKELAYFQEITISLYENGIFKPLNILDYGEKLKDMEIDLYYGRYKILIATRLPKGNIVVKSMIININKENYTISLEENKIEPDKLLLNSSIENISFSKGEELFYLYDILKTKPVLIAWLQEGSEPTEHILNELIERAKIFNEIDLEILLVIKEKKAMENVTLQKLVHSIPKAKVVFDEFDSQSEYVARRMYKEPGVYPLIIMVNKNCEAVYGNCGYNVGTADMILKLYNCM